jgi:hypothetical protein
MLEITLYTFILLLFTFCFLFISGLLQVFFLRSRKRSRLTFPYQSGWIYRVSEYLTRRAFLYKNISFMLETIHSGIQVKIFYQVSGLLLLIGILLGSLVFLSFKGVIILGIILSTTPYIMLRMKLTSLQMKTRVDFLPAVEVFYQYYVLSASKNIRVVLGKSLQEKRIMYPMKPIFEQLHRNLSTHRDVDESLFIFSMALGHTWAEHFVNILCMAMLEGVDISKNMKELIVDMRKAQRADQVERNRLLEIRIANFTPIFFLGIFLFINFQMNYSNAYHYYLIDANGRNLLLDALLLIFASFIMGLYLSIKRM